MNALQLLFICLAGWLNRNQQLVIEYLQEVKVLREQMAHLAIKFPGRFREKYSIGKCDELGDVGA